LKNDDRNVPFLQQVSHAKSKSGNAVDFFKDFVAIIVNTIGFTVGLALTFGLWIAMIVIGAIYLKGCTLNEYIPIWLIVTGCFGLMKNISSLIHQITNMKNNEKDKNAETTSLDCLTGIFLFAWFIAGNVWVYTAYSKFTTDDELADTFCHKHVYWTSFWVITVTYICFLVMFCCGCGTCCCIWPSRCRSTKQYNTSSNKV